MLDKTTLAVFTGLLLILALENVDGSTGLLACPKPDVLNVGTCAQECQSDRECKDPLKKCCFNGCGMSCLTAVGSVSSPCSVDFCGQWIPCPFDAAGTFSDEFLSLYIKDDLQKTQSALAKANLQTLDTAQLLNMTKLDCKATMVLASVLSRVDSNVIQGWISTLSTGAVDIGQIKTIPAIAFKLLKKEEVIGMVGRMTAEQKACMCKFSLKLDMTMVDLLKPLVCDPSISTLCGASGDTTAQVCSFGDLIDKMVPDICLEAKPASQRTTDDWTKIFNDARQLESLVKDEGEVDKIPDNVISQSVDTLAEKCKEFTDENIKDSLKKKAMKIIETTSDSTTKRTLMKLSYACGASSTEIEKHFTEKEVVDNFEDDALTNMREKEEMRKALLRERSDPSTYTKDDVSRYITLLAGKSDKLKELDKTTLVSSLDTISKKSFNKREKQNIIDTVKGSQEFSDPSTFNSEKVGKLGNLLSGFDRDEIKAIPANALGEAIAAGNLSEAEFPKGTDKDVIKKYKEHLGKTTANTPLTATEVEKLGNLAVSLEPTDFEAMSAAELKNLLQSDRFTDLLKKLGSKLKTASRQKIAEKVKTVADGLETLMKHKIFKNFIGELNDNKRREIVSQVQSGTKVDLEVSKSDCKQLYEEFGPVKTWTDEMLESLRGSNLMSCIPAKDVDLDSLEVMKYMPQSGEDTPSEKTNEKFVEATKSWLATATPEEIANKKDDVIEAPQVALRLPKSSLETLGECTRFIDALKNADLDSCPCDKLADKVDFLLECLNVAPGGDITSEVLEKAGNLKCALQPVHYSRITVEALSDYNPDIAKCPCQRKEQNDERNKALRDKSIIPRDASQLTEEHIATLGADVKNQEITFTDSITDGVLVAQLPDILEAIEELDTRKLKREKRGLRPDNSAEDDMEMDERKDKLYEKALDATVRVKSSQSVTGRKKRNIQPGGLTCRDMQAMQKALSGIRVDQIAAIDNAEFIKCVGTLGSVIDFSPEQRRALVEKARAAFGAETTWTAQQITEMARIVIGLPASALGQLQFTLDQLTSFGEYFGWNIEQLQSLFTKFVQISSLTDLSTVTEAQLNSLGNLLCGASPNGITTLPSSTYGLSAENIGNVKGCPKDVLVSLALKAKDEFGANVSQWSDAVITKVGAVLGGLMDDIASLTESQINAIDPVILQNIPPSALDRFTLDQLEYFSSAQAQSSLRQSCNLSSDKRARLLALAGQSKDPCLDRNSTATLPPRDHTLDDRGSGDRTSPGQDRVTQDLSRPGGVTSPRPVRDRSTGDITSPSVTPRLPASQPSRPGGSTTPRPVRGSTTQGLTRPNVAPTSPSTQPDICPASECPFECEKSVTLCSRMFANGQDLLDTALSEIIKIDRTGAVKLRAKENFNTIRQMLDERKLSCAKMFELIRQLSAMQIADVQDIVSQHSGNAVDIRKILAIPPTIMASLKRDVVLGFTSNVTGDTNKACLCKMGYKLDCVTRAVMKNETCSKLDCSETNLIQNVLCPVDEDVATEIKERCLQKQLEQKDIGSWTASDFSSFLTDTEAVETAALQANILDNMDKDAILAKRDLLKNTCSGTTDPAVKDELKQKAVELGKLASGSDKTDLLDIAKTCGAKATEFSFATRTERLSLFDDSQISDPVEKKEFKDIFEAEYTDLSQLQAADVAKYAALIVEDESKLGQIPENVLKTSLPDITQKALDTKAAQNVLKSIRQTSDYSDLTALDATKVENLGNAARGLKKSELATIPDAALGGALASGKLKDVEWTDSAVDTLVEKAKSHLGKPNGDFTADDLEKFGTDLVLKMDLEDLRKIPSSELKTWLGKTEVETKLKEKQDEVDISKLRVITEKVSAESGGKDVLLKFEKLSENVAIDDTKREELATKVQNGQKLEEKFSKSEGRRIYEKIGKLSTLSSDDLKNMKDSNVLGAIPPADFEETIQGDLTKGLEFIAALGESTDSEPSEKLNEKMTDSIEEQLKTATSDRIAVIKEKVKQNDQVLVRLPYDTLDNMGACEELISKLKYADISTVPCQKLKRKFKFYQKCKNILTASELTLTHLEEAGSLLCSVDISDYKRFQNESLKRYNSYISKCACQETDSDGRRQVLESKSVVGSDPSQYTEEDIVTLGTDVLEQSEDRVNSIPSNVLESQLPDTLSQFKEKEQTETKRRQRGFRNDKSDTKKKQSDERRTAFKKRAIDATISTRAQQAGRRRRSTASLTCDEMRNLQTALSALTLDQINAMATNDFSDCADILGQTDSFNAAQEEALAAKAIQAWGATSTWSSSNINLAGRILQGLSVSDLKGLSLTVDHIYSMGAYADWEDTKKTALFSKYMTADGHSDPSTITGSQLQSLNHMVCGADTSQLSQITAANYGAAASTIGGLTSCSDQQLVELANLAKAHYSSDVSTWDGATVTDIGIVIGGLSSSDVNKLTETHINAIADGHVYYIPPTTLSYFSTTQLGYFSSAQAQAVSADQRSALSAAQISTLESVAGISYSDTTQSGAVKVVVSWFLTLAVTVSLYQTI